MANTQVTGDLIADGAITAAKLSNVTTDTISEGTALYYTDARVASYLSANSYATEGYVTTAVNNLIDSAPASLDTLNELAAALNDDANFATTVTNALATKLNLSGGNITGNLSVDTDLLFVDTVNDRVGIGTSSPSYPLDVYGGGGIRLRDDANLRFVRIIPANSTAASAPAQIDSNSTLGFAINVAGSERMRIDSSGNVGIGTSSPAAKLDVAAASVFADLITINGSSSGQLLRLNSKDNTGDNYIAFYQNDGTRQGYIGYGYTGLNNFELYQQSNHPILVSTNGLERMRITSAGNVGIGTSSPVNRLTVSGDIGYTGVIGQGSIYGTSGNASFATIQLYNGATGFSVFNNESYGYNFNTGGTNKVTILNNGNVGIGTSSPAQKLTVSGSVWASGYYITALQGNSQLTNASTSSGSNPSYIGQGLISVTISDKKSKVNFGNVGDKECLGEVLSLSKYVKKFDWIDEDWKSEKGRTIGMVAQEVDEEFSKYVHKPKNYEDHGWAIRYQEIVPTLIKAAQELKDIVDQQQIEIDNLKAQLNG